MRILVNELTAELQISLSEKALISPVEELLRFWKGGTNQPADFFGSAHGLERARDHLGCATAARVVRSLGFEQLGVSETDPALAVQGVEEGAEFRRDVPRRHGG